MKNLPRISSKNIFLILSALYLYNAESTDTYKMKSRVFAESAPLATATFLGFCDTHACRNKTAPQATFHQLQRIAKICATSVLYNSIFITGKRIAQGQSRIQRIKSAIKEDFKRESIPQTVLTFGCYMSGKIIYYTLGKKLLHLDAAS